MEITKDTIELVGKFEGLRLEPYLCSAGVATIGYGSTFYADGTIVVMTDGAITKNVADELLERHLKTFSKEINKHLKVNLTKNQFDAVVSLVYNIGLFAFVRSTLLRKININPMDVSIASEFLRWSRIKGIENEGLKKRRLMESKLYFKI